MYPNTVRPHCYTRIQNKHGEIPGSIIVAVDYPIPLICVRPLLHCLGQKGTFLGQLVCIVLERFPSYTKAPISHRHHANPCLKRREKPATHKVPCASATRIRALVSSELIDDHARVHVVVDWAVAAARAAGGARGAVRLRGILKGAVLEYPS